MQSARYSFRVYSYEYFSFLNGLPKNLQTSIFHESCQLGAELLRAGRENNETTAISRFSLFYIRA